MKETRIKIACKTKEHLKLEELTEFQGGLKKRDETDIDKIVRSIRKFGFTFPFFVWKHKVVNNVLDGHGRILGLRKLDELGFKIPPLPVVYVSCKSERDARDLLLRLNSQYGRMTKESVLEFIGSFEIETGELELPGGSILFEAENPKPEGFDDEKDNDDDASGWHRVKCPECNKYFYVDDDYNVIKEA